MDELLTAAAFVLAVVLIGAAVGSDLHHTKGNQP